MWADNAGLGGAAAGVGLQSEASPSQESEKELFGGQNWLHLIWTTVGFWTLAKGQ